jgi:dTDP-4-dehydrorhamnose 3,5-epimerase
MEARMKVEATTLDGVKRLWPSTNFEDFRGSYVELYNRRDYHEAGLDVDFLQDDISTSSRHVLRGIHGDRSTWKLISCLHGSFYLMVVNWIPGHPQFRRWEAFTLSDRNRQQILVPPGFGNGHLVLTDVAIFHYKQSTYYDRDTQFTLRWDDPALGLWWPVASPILSPRDRDAPLLEGPGGAGRA